MRYRAGVVAVLIVLGVLACNVPTEPIEPTPIELELPTQAGSDSATEAAGEPTQEIVLPDIEGTVNAQPSATTDPDEPANISGAIGYPSEGHPAMRVYALRTDGQRYFYVDVRENAGRYVLELPPGEYYILAEVPTMNDGVFEAGYTEYSKCLRDADDPATCDINAHDLIAILAQPGQVIEDIDILDWFPTDGAFPGVPG